MQLLCHFPDEETETERSGMSSPKLHSQDLHFSSLAHHCPVILEYLSTCVYS